MGQYHIVANLDKKQFLMPHRFDNGLKLREFGCSGGGTLMGLTLLLAAQNKGGARGGGDWHIESPLVGSWAGDRIVIAGDYPEKGEIGDGIYHDAFMTKEECDEEQ